MLEDIPRSMPAMLEAGKLGSRAAKVGFDWPDANGLFEKLQEEIGELKAELSPSSADQTPLGSRSRDGRSSLHRYQSRSPSQS